MSEHVEVCRCYGQMRASVVKSKLDDAGIPAMLSYESIGRIMGLTVDGIGEVRVLVPAEYAEEARKLLAEEETLEEEGPVAPELD